MATGRWYQCPRNTDTGHRFSDQLGFIPVQTRDYPPWPWWPLELLSRVAARKVGKGKLSERLVRGIEPEDVVTDWGEAAGSFAFPNPSYHDDDKETDNGR